MHINEPCALHHYRGFPVLSNFEPPAISRKAAVDNLIEKTNLHDEWPLCNYVFFPLRNCLPSCRHVWIGIVKLKVVVVVVITVYVL